MKYLTDMHIHTVSSGHAYSTIDEIAREASKKQLKIIGISDHNEGLPGGAHEYHFNNLGVVPRVLYDVYVLRGMEANIVDFDGTIDATEATTKGLDYVIASYHPPCIPFGTIEACTKGIIGAMENPLVKIIGHPGDARYPFVHEEVVRASKRTDTLLEINNASLRPGAFRPGVKENLIEMLKVCNRLDVPILANTDAHIAYQVGDFTETKQLLEAIQFPKTLVLNTMPEKIMAFIEG